MSSARADYFYGDFLRRPQEQPVISLSLDPKDILNSSFRIAAREGRVDDMRKLLEKGANIDSQSDQGETALIYASRNCSIPVVQFLLEHKADPNLKNRLERTALIYAAMGECFPVVKLLTQDGSAWIEGRDRFGKSALDYAIEESETDVAGPSANTVDLLLEIIKKRNLHARFSSNRVLQKSIQN